jgi:hypothetical protein
MDNLAKSIDKIYNASIDMQEAAKIWSDRKQKQFMNTVI